VDGGGADDESHAGVRCFLWVRGLCVWTAS
jgi:hypothetical protein